MKKFLSLMVALILVCGVVAPVNAQTSQLTKAQNYWLNKKELNSLDAILTVEALGLNVEDTKNGFVVNFDFTAPVDSYGNEITYEDMDGGYLSKCIMTLAAMKIDPAKFVLADGSAIDLIAILKSKIDVDGNVFYGYGNPESSIVYTMYALASVDPNYDLSKLGAKLVSLQLDDGCWGYNGAWGGPDITGWAVGALSLCGEVYQDSIDKALVYFTTILKADGAFVPAGTWSSANANTQSCVVWGLLEYDEKKVKSGEFKNSYDLLMSFMLEDGSFAYGLNDNYGNEFATVQAALAVGVYENGSLFNNIRTQYDSLFAPETEDKDEIENKPVEVPVVDSINNEFVAAKTGDDTLVMASVFSLIVVGGMYLVIRKGY